MSIIKVNYKVSSTAWHNRKNLAILSTRPILSFDIETKGLYSKKERKQALSILNNEELPLPIRRIASVVGNNSGLSFPSLVNVSHFIFGLNKETSVILIVKDFREELMVWNWLAAYHGRLLIHNTLFDLKVMYHRIRKFPLHYEDTALMVKTLINNSKTWKAKIGLKELMGSYYSPEWTLIDEYEPENPKDLKFLRYAAIDGAATFYLYKLLQKELTNENS